MAKKIAIFGDADESEIGSTFDVVKEIATELAKSGYTIINGGGPGIMKAATLGAKEGGGKVEAIVVDPKYQPKNFEGMDKESYDMADDKYMAKSFEERENVLIDRADAYVVFKGGTGTLFELASVWQNAKILASKKPIIIFGKDWQEIIEMIRLNLPITSDELKSISFADSIEEIKEILFQAGVVN